MLRFRAYVFMKAFYYGTDEKEYFYEKNQEYCGGSIDYVYGLICVRTDEPAEPGAVRKHKSDSTEVHILGRVPAIQSKASAGICNRNLIF